MASQTTLYMLKTISYSLFLGFHLPTTTAAALPSAFHLFFEIGKVFDGTVFPDCPIRFLVFFDLLERCHSFRNFLHLAELMDGVGTELLQIIDCLVDVKVENSQVSQIKVVWLALLLVLLESFVHLLAAHLHLLPLDLWGLARTAGPTVALDA